MDDESEDDNIIIEEDYYAFLNVPRNAESDDINNAYRRLSRLYHPDKHVDAARKKEADVLFNKTKKAYEVLSDAHKRAIYDSLGTKGLETEGWEIVQRTKTPQEIREEYDRLAREREERRLQQRTNPRGNMVVNINATDIFCKYDYDLEFEQQEVGGLPLIEISGMSLSQSIEAPLTLRNTLTMSGQIATHNGTGSGAVTLSGRRLLSEKGWLEAMFTVGNGPVIGIKAFRSLTKLVFLTGATQLALNPDNLSLSFGHDITVGMQLDKSTVTYVTHRGGSSSAMSTTLARDTECAHYGFTLLLGIPHSYASLHYTHKLKEQELKLKTALKAGTFGALLEYSAEKKVSDHSSVLAAVSVGVPTGVTLKIKVSRASQTYVFPIHLSDEPMLSPVFYATIAPLAVWVILKRFVIEPVAAEQKKRDKQRQREANKNRMEERRREAVAAVNLMSATYERQRGEEEARRGLVIVRAVYGRLVATAGSTHVATDGPEEIIDVTIPLQCLVKDSKLVIHESSKSQLPGFYDPCVGEEKALCIQYLFHSHLHETTVEDNEPLRIPKQSHRVNAT